MTGKEKIVGILGGMGPDATIDLFQRITRITPAKKDQDHLRIIIDSNPKIPDRTKSIFKKGPSPVPMGLITAKNLEKAGADFIVVPCNTIHFYHERLQRGVRIPILSMIDLTARYVEKKYPSITRVGLLATTGTVKSRLYDRAMKRIGVEIIVSPQIMQRRVMKAIYEIKAGNMSDMTRDHLMNAAENLLTRGAEAIVKGCTEISFAIREGDLPVRIIDPMQILAETAVLLAFGGRLR